MAALLIGSLGLAGCGGSSSGSTSPGGGAAASNNAAGAAGAGSGDTSDPLVKYSACMRAHGVPSFPDPVDGRLQLQMRTGTDLDPQSPTFQAAQTACKALEPAGLGKGSGANGGQQDALLKFVACMRKNGVPGFPDPQSDGRILINRSSGVDPESAPFKAAQETCRTLLPGGVAPGAQ